MKQPTPAEKTKNTRTRAAVLKTFLLASAWLGFGWLFGTASSHLSTEHYAPADIPDCRFKVLVQTAYPQTNITPVAFKKMMAEPQNFRPYTQTYVSPHCGNNREHCFRLEKKPDGLHILHLNRGIFGITIGQSQSSYRIGIEGKISPVSFQTVRWTDYIAGFFFFPIFLQGLFYILSRLFPAK